MLNLKHALDWAEKVIGSQKLEKPIGYYWTHCVGMPHHLDKIRPEKR